MIIERNQKGIPNYGANWDDLPPVPVVGARLGSTAPTLTTFQGNIEQYTFDNVNDYIIGASELTHGYKEGSDLMAHVHWATNGTDGTDRTVKWQMEYTISNADASSPFTESYPSSTTISAEATIPASTADRANILTSLGTIDGSSIKIGAYVVFRFERIASSGTEPSNNPFAIAVGFHVEQNSLGSRTVGIK